MRSALTLAVLCLSACASPREKCERVARRLMPHPSAEFVERCETAGYDSERAKTIDCLLAVETDSVPAKDLERCGATQHLPPFNYF